VSSFFAPPTAIILDGYGLTDALIARLPALDKKNWRIGHFWRDVPRRLRREHQPGTQPDRR